MKYFACVSIASLSIILCGCSTLTGCKAVNDNKPVAPDSYSNQSSDKSDPQLPEMKPWWKW